MFIDNVLERNILPDFIVRQGIRRLLRQRIAEESSGDLEQRQNRFMGLISRLKQSPIAVNTSDANEQHYEVPSQFFELVLGKYLKYSCGYWKQETGRLDEAEAEMLALTMARADLRDGMDILELGCGWGSLSLFAAERLPGARYTAVSNSRTQKAYIDAQARARGISNLEIVTADMNNFKLERRFDRIVSVEMFEHMRNYQQLLAKVADMLKDDGRLFVHIFTHKEFSYLFEDKDASDWMTRYFFSGGIMPSDHLLLYFDDHLQIERHWRVNGRHYQKTAEAWLANMDHHRDDVMRLFNDTYGGDQTKRWWVYWRVFFMACAELWGFDNGEEWFVSHYLFRKRT